MRDALSQEDRAYHRKLERVGDSDELYFVMTANDTGRYKTNTKLIDIHRYHYHADDVQKTLQELKLRLNSIRFQPMMPQSILFKLLTACYCQHTSRALVAGINSRVSRAT